MERPIIYQLLPRLFSNLNPNCVPSGTIRQNSSGKMEEIDDVILKEIRSLGTTHVWYTGILEHATKTDYSAYGIPSSNPHVVKGEAGSPYAIRDYYDIDPDLAVDPARRMDEFERLVSRTHNAGMKVIIDFVPNHVAREYISDSTPSDIRPLGADDNPEIGFTPANNFFYCPLQQFAPRDVNLGHGPGAYIEFPAKATGNDCYHAFPGRNDWYDTAKLNYGVDPMNGWKCFDPIPDTWHKMLHILNYWAGKGVDGFRCDMAHMVPVEFWQWAIADVKANHPGTIFIAELYDTHIYEEYITRGGFDYLYDKVNLYDTLRGIQCSDFSAARITSCWQTVGSLAPNMLNFLENHDEQRFGSRFYAGDPSLVTPSLVVSAMIGTGAMMIYAGQELGEQATDTEGYSGFDGRTSIFDYWSVPTLRRWISAIRSGNPDDGLTVPQKQLRDLYARVLTLCNTEESLRSGRFFDLMYVNYQNPSVQPHRHFAFLRASGAELLVILVNFSSEAATMHVNIPQHAFDFFGIMPGSFRSRELLSDQTRTISLSPDRQFSADVPGYGAAIWKIKFKNATVKAKKSPVKRTAKAKIK